MSYVQILHHAVNGGLITPHPGFLFYLLHSKPIMRYALAVSLCLLLFPLVSSAQPRDSIGARKDSIRMAQMLEISQYPLIKGSKWSGVIPVKDPTEIPDPNQQYKLLFELASDIKDSAAAKEIHGGLAEIGRVINLHVASGIPAKNLDIVVVVHGGALKALLNDREYKKNYGIRNPNIAIIRQFLDAGARFIACGQAMWFKEITREEMIPEVKISVTAQTVLSNYRLKGYILFQ
jgi:intracellular sulfur oxidation DsrE/DsrF family protein